MFSSVNAIRQIRKYSNRIQKQSKSMADIIKKVNYENKALFGPVQKRKNAIKIITTPINVENNLKSNNSSEYYWLFHHKQNKNHLRNISSIKTKKKLNVFKDVNKIKSTSNSDSKIIKNSFDENFIPFTKSELKKILKLPLILDENYKNMESESKEHCHEIKYPSVSKILQNTLSDSARNALIKWKLSKISELGEDGFNQLQQDHLERGKRLHETLESYLSTDIQPEIHPKITNLWKSIYPALETLKLKVKLIEIPVEHPILKYKGVVDCVSTIKNDLSVVEWKKSDKHKTRIESTYDAPIQLVAYLGALSADSKYKIYAKNGYVIVAYSDSKIADVHHLNEIQLRTYWEIWKKKVQEFWIRTRDGTLPEPF